MQGARERERERKSDEEIIEINKVGLVFRRTSSSLPAGERRTSTVSEIRFKAAIFYAGLIAKQKWK